MNRLIILSLVLLRYQFLISSPLLYSRTIENNSIITEVVVEENSIFFFCPIKYLAKEKYLEKATDLITSNSLSGIQELKVNLFFFTEDSEYFSGGPNVRLKTINRDTTFIINDFEAFFLGFNNFKNCLQRKVISRYYSYLEYGISNSYNVSAQKGITCFKSLDERIPFYQNVIKEYFYPSYSIDEQIQQLKDSLQLLNSKVVILEKEILVYSTKLNAQKETNTELPSNNDQSPVKKRRTKIIYIRNEE